MLWMFAADVLLLLLRVRLRLSLLLVFLPNHLLSANVDEYRALRSKVAHLGFR